MSNNNQLVIEKENHQEKVTSPKKFEPVKHSMKNEEIRTESDSLGIVEKMKISLIGNVKKYMNFYQTIHSQKHTCSEWG